MKTDDEALSRWAALHPGNAKPVVVVVMGVSGSGKTTVAALFAAMMHWAYADADDLHPPANVDKMRRGIALTDEDRAPWLARIAQTIDAWRQVGSPGVVTCSALKRAYRDVIVNGHPDVLLAYLKGDHDLIARRMAARHEHFMPVGLLDSQFGTLEEPMPDERPIVLDVSGTPQEIVIALAEAIETRQRTTPER